MAGNDVEVGWAGNFASPLFFFRGETLLLGLISFSPESGLACMTFFFTRGERPTKNQRKKNPSSKKKSVPGVVAASVSLGISPFRPLRLASPTPAIRPA
jgi:hypothetical protein